MTNITLNTIKDHNPCTDGWAKLLESLGKTKPDDEPITLEYILESNGIEDAIWALRCLEYKDECLFRADVAESVLHVFESKYPNDNRPRNAIEATRRWHEGRITDKELKSTADAADAAYAAYAAAAYATYAYANAYAAAAAYAADAAAYADAAAAYAADAAKWKEIEQLFIKHFVEKNND